MEEKAGKKERKRKEKGKKEGEGEEQELYIIGVAARPLFQDHFFS